MPCLHEVAELVLLALVDLVDQEDDGYLHLRDFLQEVHVLGWRLAHVRHVEQDVGVGECALRECQHHLLHLVVGLQHARGVGEYHLCLWRVDDAHDAMACGLGLEGRYTDLFAHELVHERALAHIRVAHDVDESCFVLHNDVVVE